MTWRGAESTAESDEPAAGSAGSGNKPGEDEQRRKSAANSDGGSDIASPTRLRHDGWRRAGPTCAKHASQTTTTAAQVSQEGTSRVGKFKENV